MLAYFILDLGLFVINLAYFLKRLVLKQQVFPRIEFQHKLQFGLVGRPASVPLKVCWAAVPRDISFFKC